MTGNWPQPYEGIAGDDASWARGLLSLDEDAVPYRDALLVLTRHLGTATLVGGPAPVVRRMGDRMRHPRAGDLVASSYALMSRDPDTRIKGLGVLLCPERREWAETDAQWEARCAAERAAILGNSDYTPEEADDLITAITGEDNRATELSYYIQYGPAAGDICRWHNDDCVMVPVSAVSFSLDAAVSREETPGGGQRVTFTRDSLIGGLGDSGFRLRGEPGPLPDREQPYLVTVHVPGGRITDVREEGGYR
jgi:hypothetical protein